jgi:hypothetical protein
MGLEPFRDNGEKELYNNDYVNIDEVFSQLRRHEGSSDDITNPRIADRCGKQGQCKSSLVTTESGEPKS